MHPTNEKGPSVTSTGPLENPSITDQNFATVSSESKALATVKARFLSRGHVVHNGGDQDFFVVQANWGQSKHCKDYAELVGFGRALGVFA
jgi:hypothetical protein